MEIRQQYIYFANLTRQNKTLPACDEGKLHWVKLNTLSQLKMSYTNTECLRHYFQIGMHTDAMYACAVKTVDEQPTMVFTELSDFYTAY